LLTNDVATGNTGLNVVCNQEYAQAVPHVSRYNIRLTESFSSFPIHQVHYHIIPAPTFHSAPEGNSGGSIASTLTVKEMHRMEFESREELDLDEAEALADRVRARL
jgi:hypothetical protein